MKDPNDTRNIGPRAGSPLWAYLTLISVAGVAVIVGAVSLLHGAQRVIGQPLFWVVAAMIVAGEICPIVTPGKSRPEAPAASITVSFAALLYWGPPLAILLRVAGRITTGVARRSAVHRMVFNAAQESLSLAAAGLAIGAAGFDPRLTAPRQLSGHDLPIVLAAAVAYFVVNFTLVGGAIALHSRTPLLAIFRESLPYQGVVHAVMLATAPLVTLAMLTGSGIMVALFTLPLAALYVNAAMSVRREYQAQHDELTGLSNRGLLIKRSEEALAKGALAGTRTGFLLIDLDGFKKINDTLGHAAGDLLLQVVAYRLIHSVRPGDLVARLGGDEFAVLLPSVKEEAVAREVATRLRAALGEPVRIDAMSMGVQASVGIAICPDDAGGLEQLMRRADVAMYLAKERCSGIERYLAEADVNPYGRFALGGGSPGVIRRGAGWPMTSAAATQWFLQSMRSLRVAAQHRSASKQAAKSQPRPGPAAPHERVRAEGAPLTSARGAVGAVQGGARGAAGAVQGGTRGAVGPVEGGGRGAVGPVQGGGRGAVGAVQEGIRGAVGPVRGVIRSGHPVGRL